MATHRTIDAYNYFNQIGQTHKPRMAFAGRNKQQFAAWKKKTLPQVLATLGQSPAKVPLNPELVTSWEEDGLVKERWLIDTQPGLSAVLLIFRPAGLARGEKRPAILCCHGHGTEGKNAVMGIADRPTKITPYNYDYGLQMAQKGFVTYAIDWLGFGERDSRKHPNSKDSYGGRDACNINYLCATMLGTTVLAMNLHDAKVATDFVASRPYADGGNLGVMGLSLGGTMTTWAALYDERFKAIDILCYAGPFYDIAYRAYNVCGSQVTPGIFGLVDTADLQGLIAPRPLLVEYGIHDMTFNVDYAYGKHYPQLERIYRAAEVDLEVDLFPGPHAWGDNKSETFFRKHLAAKW